MARASTCLEMPQRKAVAQYLWADLFVDDACSSPEPNKQERYAIDRQSLSALGEEETIFSRSSPQSEFRLGGTMLLQMLAPIVYGS